MQSLKVAICRCWWLDANAATPPFLARDLCFHSVPETEQLNRSVFLEFSEKIKPWLRIVNMCPYARTA
jgi:hypothetical protein